jgi:endo-1,4-beta-D-glucanase Y
MKVRELFDQEAIDLEWLTDNLEGQDTYSNNAFNFISENWDRDVDNLSAKQGAWLTKILDDCVEKRIEG